MVFVPADTHISSCESGLAIWQPLSCTSPCLDWQTKPFVCPICLTYAYASDAALKPSTKATRDCSGLVFLSSSVCKFFSFPGRSELKAGMRQKLLATLIHRLNWPDVCVVRMWNERCTMYIDVHAWITPWRMPFGPFSLLPSHPSDESTQPGRLLLDMVSISSETCVISHSQPANSMLSLRHPVVQRHPCERQVHKWFQLNAVNSSRTLQRVVERQRCHTARVSDLFLFFTSMTNSS